MISRSLFIVEIILTIIQNAGCSYYCNITNNDGMVLVNMKVLSLSSGFRINNEETKCSRTLFDVPRRDRLAYFKKFLDYSQNCTNAFPFEASDLSSASLNCFVSLNLHCTVYET